MTRRTDGWWGGTHERDRVRLRDDGEVRLRSGDTALYDDSTGEVIIIETGEPRLSPGEARGLLDRLSVQPVEQLAG